MSDFIESEIHRSRRDRVTTLVRTIVRTLTILAASYLPCAGLSAQPADNATSLRATYESLKPQLDHAAFHRRLYLDSRESPSTVTGEIYAVLDYPFGTVSDVFNDPTQSPKNWCDVLILHPNIKYCHASANSSGDTLTVYVSQEEVAEELASTYRLQFDYEPATTSPGYFRLKLHSDSGPLNTRDYQIVLEAVSLGSGRTFLHLTYAYSYGAIGRLAMKGYLATFGHGKVGFTNLAEPSAAEPKFVDGVRGLVERNTMRYYLAIDAYLGEPTSLPDNRVQQRLSNWFSASEQYPRQLHEIDRQQYMEMKQEEYRRQQARP
ncbi:hypothetical protein AB3X91_07665 [Paraburkholderia sp. BR14263]|uniref:hypothetical protein n=1 Tax=unclassified Paraburkholderia TaxID=2615204 RepID=UPI0034CDE770